MVFASSLPPMDHSVPPDGLTVEASHQVMQLHIDCPITICSIKHHAKTVLIRNGHLHPADRTKFGY